MSKYKDYYNDKKFKPGDRVFYIFEDGNLKIHTTGTVLSIEEIEHTYLENEEVSKSVVYDIFNRVGNKNPIFALWDHDNSVGWMAEHELYPVSEISMLLYTEE